MDGEFKIGDIVITHGSYWLLDCVGHRVRIAEIAPSWVKGEWLTFPTRIGPNHVSFCAPEHFRICETSRVRRILEQYEV